MRIKRIRIENFLSFDTFEWEDLDPHLNVVVGPNGAGKTNLFHALRALLDVLDPSAQGRRNAIRHSAYKSGDRRRTVIAITVCFDTDWEIDVLRAFLAASLCEPGNTLRDPTIASSYGLRRRVSELDVSPLLSGVLVVACDESGVWSSYYESDSEDFYFMWHFEGSERGTVMGARASDYEWIRETFNPGRDSADDLNRVRYFVPNWFRRPPEVAQTEDIRLQLNVESGFVDRLPTHQHFTRLLGLSNWGSRPYTGRDLFHTLARRGLVFTDNVRRLPLTTFSLEEFNTPTLDLSNGEQLALYLHQLKDGSREERVRYVAVQRLFERLMRQGFDVGTATPRVTEGNLDQAEFGRSVQLELRTTPDWGDVPFEYSGAGRAEGLLLSTLIAAASGRVVLLDEPAQTLHPTVQTSLVRQMRQPDGNQYLVVTHSAHLIPSDAIDVVSRFYPTDDGCTARASLNHSQFKAETMRALQAELRGATDARALLFANGVILVEGDTEFGTLPVWYENLFGHPPDAEDVVVYNAGGDRGFRAYLQFLNQYRVPWVVVCDGAVIGESGLRDRERCSIAEQLRDAWVDGLQVGELQAMPFEARRSYLERHGVFTVARSAKKGEEGYEDAVVLLRDNMDRLSGSSKTRKARRLADENRSCPPEVEELLRKVKSCLDLRMRRDHE